MEVGAAPEPGEAVGRERSEQDCASGWRKQERRDAFRFDGSGALFSYLGSPQSS